MHAVREIFWLSTLYSINVRGVHVPGSSNVAADAVSRLHQLVAWPRLEACFGHVTDAGLLVWPWLVLCHMSYKSFVFLFPQALRWIRSRRS